MVRDPVGGLVPRHDRRTDGRHELIAHQHVVQSQSIGVERVGAFDDEPEPLGRFELVERRCGVAVTRFGGSAEVVVEQPALGGHRGQHQLLRRCSQVDALDLLEIAPLEPGFGGQVVEASLDALGIGHCMEGRRIFSSLSVEENLLLAVPTADRAASGVAFSLDTETGFRDVVFVTGCYGLGETIVQGQVDPDEFYVHKPTFVNGFRSVLRKTLGDKQVHMVYAPGRTREPVINKPTPRADRKRYCLSDADVLVLADATANPRFAAADLLAVKSLRRLLGKVLPGTMAQSLQSFACPPHVLAQERTRQHYRESLM